MVVTRAISNFEQNSYILDMQNANIGKKIGSSLDMANNLKEAFFGKFCQISTFTSGYQYETLTQFITLPVSQTVIVTR